MSMRNKRSRISTDVSQRLLTLSLSLSLFTLFTISLSLYALHVLSFSSHALYLPSVYLLTLSSLACIMLFAISVPLPASLDLQGLQELWQYLGNRFFLPLELEGQKVAQQLEGDLKRLYLVTAMKTGQKKKVTEFFTKMISWPQ